jgi:uncharacterized protein YukE
MQEPGEIKLNLDDAATSIEKLKTCKTNLQNSYDQLVTAHASLNANWKGNSGTAFSSCSEAMEKNLKGRMEGLQKLIDMLEDSKLLFVDTDANLFKA